MIIAMMLFRNFIFFRLAENHNFNPHKTNLAFLRPIFFEIWCSFGSFTRWWSQIAYHVYYYFQIGLELWRNWTSCVRIELYAVCFEPMNSSELFISDDLKWPKLMLLNNRNQVSTFLYENCTLVTFLIRSYFFVNNIKNNWIRAFLFWLSIKKSCAITMLLTPFHKRGRYYLIQASIFGSIRLVWPNQI